VICLRMHHELGEEEVNKVLGTIVK